MPKFIVCHTIGKGIKKIEMTQEETDKKYMQRCIQLAKNGRQNAKPNPMVGAVLIFDDRIIGEGYHVRCGEGHAEVNCFASVKPDISGETLSKSTLYVSLEPCSHYGRTPPCADLIIRKGVKRVVVGCIDPFAKVQGRGIKKLQEAGIDVTVGVLEQECQQAFYHLQYGASALYYIKVVSDFKRFSRR
jgi:diaminohydroxyphosphoribosylaminopyrimidine deaminase/5-amino-6-(5-phosphoribosylamino)uracil reductase